MHGNRPCHLDTFSHIGVFSGGSIDPEEIDDLAGFKKKVKLVSPFFSTATINPNPPFTQSLALPK